MKKLVIIIASVFLFGTFALAGEGGSNKKSLNESTKTQIKLSAKINNMLTYPSDILDGKSEAIMIAYSIDENNIIHVDEILSSNIALKQYVLKHMDGKKMRNMYMEGKNGVVKVQFNGNESQKLYLQY
jgi:hypothetical protein